MDNINCQQLFLVICRIHTYLADLNNREKKLHRLPRRFDMICTKSHFFTGVFFSLNETLFEYSSFLTIVNLSEQEKQQKENRSNLYTVILLYWKRDMFCMEFKMFFDKS
ncbi:hypothetical protein BpHYR1_010189 [Brachionus plicatilis]|uniref:Uncharacterized protein n=1 Tax=Brachionus plicatilis TaxID=10195 RepID=A0A3M7PKD7_BRAPC|nr:hypothetical protein BpHYR1_010189 [Brachionus plicatilis]